MRNMAVMIAMLAGLLTCTHALAQDQTPRTTDGSSVRPDHDGDGVPNGQDTDWGRWGGTAGPSWVDEDGDGRCDNLTAGRACPARRGGWARGRRGGGWGRDRGAGWNSASGTPACGRGQGLPPCGRGFRR